MKRIPAWLMLTVIVICMVLPLTLPAMAEESPEPSASQTVEPTESPVILEDSDLEAIATDTELLTSINTYLTYTFFMQALCFIGIIVYAFYRFLNMFF